ncbi:uncharacterized protein KY384_000934 [Bacidia gigantensis]|uniref:uncharacterized protein n=1 Tax=Bacidia gigantensis TaxID=2732470 RepID=UPI001D037480|nr:uncharacterized protein KY384_000934 [Bacidia gigantensis]KAG8534091.1 hypothetical protein KY384_000934 [Bacidia gigantensis]
MPKLRSISVLALFFACSVITYAAPQSVEESDIICYAEDVDKAICLQKDALALIDYLRFDAPGRDVENILTTDMAAQGPNIIHPPYDITRPGKVGTCKITLKFNLPPVSPVRRYQDRFTITSVAQRARFIFHRCPWDVANIDGLGRGGKMLGGDRRIIGVKLISAEEPDDVGDMDSFTGNITVL